MDNREKLELLRQTVLAAAQRSAEETEAETKKIIEDTVSAEKKRLSDEIADVDTPLLELFPLQNPPNHIAVFFRNNTSATKIYNDIIVNRQAKNNSKCYCNIAISYCIIIKRKAKSKPLRAA